MKAYLNLLLPEILNQETTLKYSLIIIGNAVKLLIMMTKNGADDAEANENDDEITKWLIWRRRG